MAKKFFSQQEAQAPGLVRMALELRAPWEFGMALAAYPFMQKAPAGDGHPVLVFPGLAAGDATTIFLRRFLKDLGYPAYAWEQGLNFGPRPGVLEACIDRILALREQHGQRVSLIGWSLGGVYARELAKLLPGDVRLVISLGSPFRGSPQMTNAWRLYQWVSGEPDIEAHQFAALAHKPPVPTTSIFSRTDGVVAWQCSVEDETATSENIEVHASHVGMGMNPLAMYAIADRLAQPEGQWKRFDHRGHKGLKKLLFQDPQRGALPNPFFSWY
ncbi:triacylglycerol lipase [Massilia sp. TS11]|uniref:esterase/lipase family protein n=1 Tax=Massilia sp. TS11 TaxID=2908003 RepID=UPI001EDA5B16|nr:GPI inositol-deacylase [Massilia sp. TS11]MCG2584739.1 GPI inositol-deacylase [Massilia sp. TS11]